MKRALFAVLVLMVTAGCTIRREPVDRHEVWRAIQQPAARYRLDPVFIYALVAAESGFDARARHGEARGLLQLKPAAWATVSARPYEPTVWDWRANLETGIDYLAWCRHALHAHGRFSERLLLAAFHYGFDYVESRDFDEGRIPRPDHPLYRELWRGNQHPPFAPGCNVNQWLTLRRGQIRPPFFGACRRPGLPAAGAGGEQPKVAFEPAGVCAQPCRHTMAAPPPNILWIVTTQWRAEATGYAGDPNAHTPHLDALAAGSVNYAQAVTPHPFGPFARAALLTGVRSPENGVRDYYDPLPQGARTVAHRLRARGYTTAFFGKWHLYKRDPRAELVGEAHARIIVPPAWRGGFEFWEGFEGGFLLNDPWLHGTRLPEPVKFPGYQSDVVCARAGAWIRESGERIPETGKHETSAPATILYPVSSIQNQTRPWFCVVSLEPPHPPYDAPVPRQDPGPAAGVMSRDPRAMVLPSNVPLGTEVEAKARCELAGYYAHLEATDQAIGRLLAQVPRENTVVVFTSVHGDMHGAHGLFRKGWPYEESIRVPLLVRGTHQDGLGVWVLGSGVGERNEEPVSLVDLPRWTLEWTGGRGRKTRNSKPETDIQRISMPSVVRLPHQCDRAWRGVRTRTRKLVLNEDGAPWLFFDLARDPGEEHNLAGDPDRAAEMAELRRRV